MGAIATIIGAIAEAVIGLTNVTREALARSLEEIAQEVRDGKLIPEEALEQAEKDQARIDAIKKRLEGNS